MKSKKGFKVVLGMTGLATAILLAGCTDNVTKINNENVIEIGTSKMSLDKVKENAEIDSKGKLSITEGVTTKVLTNYYNSKVNKEDVEKTVADYKKTIEKSSKQKVSDETIKELERTVKKNHLLNLAQNDLVKLDIEEIEKEQKEGYKLVRVIYALENGMGSKESKEELKNFQEDLEKAKKDTEIQKVATKYSKSTLITSGILVVSEELSIFDDEVTKDIINAKKGKTVSWKLKDSTNTENIAFVTDSWKASISEIMLYKKGAKIKETIPNNVELLKVLDKKHDDLDISKTLYDLMQDEIEGKKTVTNEN